jgi:hypothetical protein
MDKTISVYWFVILFITAGAVAYMVVAFYGAPYDVRKIEAGVLRDAIAECLSNGGYLKEGIISNESKLFINSNNFFDNCSINFKTPDFAESVSTGGEYYVEVEIIGEGDKLDKGSFEVGNINLREFCSDELIEKGSRINPVCLKTSFYVLDSWNKKYILTISALVRKTEKNVQ